MDYLQQHFSVRFEYKVHFTSGLFDPGNPLLDQFLAAGSSAGVTRKILFVIDQGVVEKHPGLVSDIRNYFSAYTGAVLAGEVLVVPGGETAKNDMRYFDSIIAAVDVYGIDRHSYIAAIGGGAVIDLVGYAAAVSHRGIRHIRIPTTVLSQNDSGIGVKNGINYKGKKNFLGTFSPPAAVFNDERFLLTLSDRDWRAGISEAVKVALIRDAEFFEWLEAHAQELAGRDMQAMRYLIRQCADLHMQHIASGDPFETGSSRPLDFGHWSAHKLEQLSGFTILHGEAVAMGIALDSLYSYCSGMLPETAAYRIMNLLLHLGFTLTHPLMDVEEEASPVLLGLQEFREHLGGRLTIMLLNDIGKGKEVHDMDRTVLREASGQLKTYAGLQQEPETAHR